MLPLSQFGVQAFYELVKQTGNATYIIFLQSRVKEFKLDNVALLKDTYFARRAKKPSAKGRSPQQELEVGLRTFYLR